jgi:UPF0716 protein FxsA
MLGKLLFAFIAIPLVEFMLLVWIADKTSFLATLGLVVLTGIVGSLLARAEGLRAWRRFHRAASEGRLPSREIQDGLMIAFAAALLLTPGILTDLLGFALLIPVSRGLLRTWLAKRLASRVRVSVSQSASPRTPEGASRDGRTVDATGWTQVDSGGGSAGDSDWLPNVGEGRVGSEWPPRPDRGERPPRSDGASFRTVWTIVQNGPAVRRD